MSCSGADQNTIAGLDGKNLIPQLQFCIRFSLQNVIDFCMTPVKMLLGVDLDVRNMDCKRNIVCELQATTSHTAGAGNTLHFGKINEFERRQVFAGHGRILFNQRSTNMNIKRAPYLGRKPGPLLPHFLFGVPCFLCLAGKGILIAQTVEVTGSPVFQGAQDVDSNVARKRAIGYLIKAQKTDGSWKSEYYGNLKQGAAITSLVLYALSHCPEDEIEDLTKNIESAFAFLGQGIRKHGFVANVSGPDYANYGSAMTLLAERNFFRLTGKRNLDKSSRAALVDFLVASQLDETHGLRPDHYDYGGWDLSGWMQSVRSSPGTNISVTRFVLEALEETDSEPVRLARHKASKWIARLKNRDHGFRFHPDKSNPGNKAPVSGGGSGTPGSYATATLDGIRILELLKMPSRQIRQSRSWLAERITKDHSLDWVPGFQRTTINEDASWGKGLLYYYWMDLAHFLKQNENLERADRTRGKNGNGVRQRLVQAIIQRQTRKGAWQNSSARMREDDTLIATSFALIALARLAESE